MEFISMSRNKLNKEIDNVRYELTIYRNGVNTRYINKYSQHIKNIIHKPNFSETEYSITISEETYYMLNNCNDDDILDLIKTLGRAVGNNVIILDISKEDHKNLSTIQDDDIFYLYLINLINKNKKNDSN